MMKPGLEKKTTMDIHDTSEKCLTDSVESAMETYFEDLDGHQASNLYSLFLEQVEKPFFSVVMKYKKGNLTQAAEILGLNRATLRNRLKKYGLD